MRTAVGSFCIIWADIWFFINSFLKDVRNSFSFDGPNWSGGLPLAHLLEDPPHTPSEQGIEVVLDVVAAPEL